MKKFSKLSCNRLCLQSFVFMLTLTLVFCKPDFESYLNSTLRNVTQLFYYNNPGTITVLNDQPFTIISGKNGIIRPHVGGTEYGRGRIITYSHSKFYLFESLIDEPEDNYDNTRLYINCIEWVGKGKPAKVGVYPWDHEIQLKILSTKKIAARLLNKSDMTNFTLLQEFDVLTVNNLEDESEYAAVRKYVQGGGGLVLAAIPYNHHIREMWSFWGNKVLNGTGLFYIGEHYGYATASYGVGFNASVELLKDTNAFTAWNEFKTHFDVETIWNEKLENEQQHITQIMKLLRDRIIYVPIDEKLQSEIISQWGKIRSAHTPTNKLSVEKAKTFLVVHEYMCIFFNHVNRKNESDYLETCQSREDSYPLLNAAKDALSSQDENSFQGWWGIAVGGLVVISITIVLGQYVIYKRNTKSEGLTENEIVQFKEGATDNIYGGNKIEINTDCLPYNNLFEISADHYNIEKESLLGSGAFGVVYKGTVNNVPVAVKSVKPGTDSKYFKSLLSELKILIYLENHPYIVNLIGADTTNLKTGEVFVFVELCHFGNLLDYLKKSRENFQPVLRFNPTNNYWQSEDINTTIQINGLSSDDFIIWCYQIVKALEYLNDKQIIHGDLAARNVLVFAKNLVKITDFGLSRKLYSYSEYVKKGQEPLPWKWMSIESLQNLTFSIQSDVWSFGVTMWEIFSLAETPYPGMSWTPNFVQLLKEGLRLQKPNNATNELYQLMLECWTINPQKRPRPEYLVSFFLDLITSRNLETKL